MLRKARYWRHLSIEVTGESIAVSERSKMAIEGLAAASEVSTAEPDGLYESRKAIHLDSVAIQKSVEWEAEEDEARP